MVHQRQCEKVARIFNVSQEFVFQHLTAEGRFNMLKAGVDYLLEYQERLAGRVGTGFVGCRCCSCKSTKVVLSTSFVVAVLLVCGNDSKINVKL